MSNVSYLFFMELIDALIISPFFFMEVIYDWSSSTLSTFDSAVSFSSLDSAVYFSSLTLLSLVSFPVLSNSGQIKVGNVSSSLLDPESYQASNLAATIRSASRRRSSTLYQKLHSSRTSYHARTYWLLYPINLVTWVPVNLNRYISYLTTIHWPLKDDRYFNAITSNFCF